MSSMMKGQFGCTDAACYVLLSICTAIALGGAAHQVFLNKLSEMMGQDALFSENAKSAYVDCRRFSYQDCRMLS